MVLAVKFQAATEHLAEGRMNFLSDTFKLMLVNAEPDAANDAFYSDLFGTEVAEQSGYITGGITLPVTSSSQTAGVYSAVMADSANILQAVLGPIGPFRYLVLYDSSSGALLQYWDLGTLMTLLENDYLTLDFLDPYVVRIT